jgi:hypothetical protein
MGGCRLCTISQGYYAQATWDAMVVAHAANNSDHLLVVLLQGHNTAHLFDLWTPYLFRTCQKVLRPGCEFEPLFGIAAHSGF